jgi:hypothetical protein
MTDPTDTTTYTVSVTATNPALSVGTVVAYKDFDAQILENDGTLRLELNDRGALYLFPRGEWRRLEAKPAPEGVEA